MRKRSWVAATAAVVVLGAVTSAAWLGRARIDAWRAARAYPAALRAVDAGDAAAEAAALREVLRLDPRHAAARRRLGELHLEHGKIEHAFLELQTLVELAPEDAAGWLLLARVWHAAELLESAEGAATQAIELGADRAAAHALRARIGDALGRATSAGHDATLAQAAGAEAAALQDIVARARARRAEPPEPPAAPARRERFWPGALAALVRDVQLALQRRQPDAAVAVVRTAEERFAHAMIGPWLHGVVAYSQGRFAEAEQHLREALARAPRSSRVATNLAGAWAKQKGPEYAGERLLELAERDAGFVVPLDIAATAFLEARQPARAEQALARGLAHELPPAAAFRYLVNFYVQMDRAAEALPVCERAVAAHPHSSDLARRCVWLLRETGDAAGAMAAYAALVAHAPDAGAAAALARLLLTHRKDAASRQRAATLVRDAQYDAPTDGDTLGDIGWVLLELGETRAAKRWLAAAIAADPQPDFRYQRARSLVKLGDNAAARTELRLALESTAPFAERAAAQRLLKELGR